MAEIGGKVKIAKNGAVLPQPFLDIGPKINDPDWAGIFSIAFPPDYQTSGFFYILCVVKSKTEVQVSRFLRQAGNADVADANSEVKILTIPYEDVLGGHRGGDMAFGKDGFLYISTGDNGPGSRGVAGDPNNNSQNLGKLFGKLLRLDTSAPAPGDNPLGKTFALGLSGGKDASVMGGFVYRGSRYPSMKGHYFFGDYSTGKIGYIDPLGGVTSDAGLTYASLISFGEDQTGELYTLSFLNGTLSRITNPGDPLPVKLLFVKLTRTGSGFLIQWKNALENKFSHFDVQRSCDWHTFETLGTVPGKGPGSAYAFTDGEPLGDT